MVSFAAGALALSERAGAFGLKSEIHINNHEMNVFPTACLSTSGGQLGLCWLAAPWIESEKSLA
jgi:hypothetical protein